MQPRVYGCVVLAGMVLTGLAIAGAYGQDSASHDGTSGPPAVLFTQREYVKPGKDMAHEKTEAAMASAMAAAKGTMYSLALSSITGEPRVVFLSGYETMGEIEKRYMETMKLPGLSAKLNQLGEEDGALVSSQGNAIWRFRPDLSTTGKVNMAEMRMMELVGIETKPGHASDFEDIAKRTIAARVKTDPEYNAHVFEMAQGHHSGPSFLVVIPMKSMDDLDKLRDSHDAFVKALGEEGQKATTDDVKSGYISSESNLFVFSPRMSYVPESWVKAAPDFWRPKPTASAKKADATK